MDWVSRALASRLTSTALTSSRPGVERACGFLGARHSFFLALDLMWEKHNQEFDIIRNRDAFQNPKRQGSKTLVLRIKGQKLPEKPLVVCVCLSLACGRACSCVCVLACFCTYTFEAISVGIVPESRVALREGIQGAAVRAAQNQVEVEAHQASQQVSPPSRAVVR